ncbi:hypothetical protein EK21DRAFT_84112 [Setomelanomma holmii]|uniref:Uncharacterized protein n=1 Tax=Setomelanomma holmii TaxID=210430 RepID=A0A9P4LSM4_9PLEO|nr:hypothetical protein EK21DRAFT_84112 [Setomelanomma holmii]
MQLGERFTHFGLSGPIQNYIKRSWERPSSCDCPWEFLQILGVCIDHHWRYRGRPISWKFKAILVASGIYIVGLVILVATATPAAIQDGAGFGGLIAAVITIGLGIGGIKANVTPMCAEQYQNARAVVKTLKSGERVVVDPELTVQKLFMWFYWVVNVGALSPLITVNVEAKQSFWLAYLIPLIDTFKVPPQSSAIVDAVKTVMIACREKGFQNAKPSMLSERRSDGKYKIARESCKIFLFFPIYFICWIQIWNNLISQAGEMALHGTPNDLLQNLDPIALIIFIPFLDCP